jgi:hypothetical protein
VPATDVAQPTPAQPNAQPAAPAQPGPSGGASAGAAAAAGAAQPAANPDQVSQAVARDFGGYDKDANGTLSQAEFAAWMTALRAASEPSFVAGSAAATAWTNQAFAAADTDKNHMVSKAEVAVFLTPKS